MDHGQKGGPKKAEERLLIVTSEHLAASYPELSEFEFGLVVASHAFERWILRCMGAAGHKDMTPVDVLVMHHVHHRDKPKKLADICFVLNIEDAHVVSYSLKKLAAAGLVQSQKHGKEVFFSATKAGRELCGRYKETRDSCLLPGFSKSEDEAARLATLAKFLRGLAGTYDQASRAATVSVELSGMGEPSDK